MTMFEELIPDPLPPGVKVLYGTVTGSSPLRVQLAGDPGPLPITPVTTVATVVGDRVVILSHVRADDPDRRARAYVIVGVIGQGDTEWVEATPINGWTGNIAFRRVLGCAIECRIGPLDSTTATGTTACYVPTGFEVVGATQPTKRFVVHTLADPPEVRRGYVTSAGEVVIRDYDATNYYGGFVALKE